MTEKTTMAMPSCFFCRRYKRRTDRWGKCSVKKDRVNIYDKCLMFRWNPRALAKEDT